MKKNVMAVPPKISVTVFRIGEKQETIKVVRDSAICRCFTKDASLIFGNTIYVRDRVLLRKVLVISLQKIEKQKEIGKLRYLWHQWKNGRKRK